MSKKQYDEKQIIDRGRSFQNAFICGIVVNVIFLVSDIIGIRFSTSAIFLLNIGLPITTYLLTMIIKNSYDGVLDDGERLNIFGWCGAGVALLIVSLPDILSGKEPLFENSMITDSAATLFVSILTLVVVVVYWVTKYNVKKRETDE